MSFLSIEFSILRFWATYKVNIFGNNFFSVIISKSIPFPCHVWNTFFSRLKKNPLKKEQKAKNHTTNKKDAIASTLQTNTANIQCAQMREREHRVLQTKPRFHFIYTRHSIERSEKEVKAYHFFSTQSRNVEHAAHLYERWAYKHKKHVFTEMTWVLSIQEFTFNIYGKSDVLNFSTVRVLERRIYIHVRFCCR